MKLSVLPVLALSAIGVTAQSAEEQLFTAIRGFQQAMSPIAAIATRNYTGEGTDLAKDVAIYTRDAVNGAIFGLQAVKQGQYKSCEDVVQHFTELSQVYEQMAPGYIAIANTEPLKVPQFGHRERGDDAYHNIRDNLAPLAHTYGAPVRASSPSRSTIIEQTCSQQAIAAVAADVLAATLLETINVAYQVPLTSSQPPS